MKRKGGRFEVEEGSIPGGRYKIKVRSRGKIIRTFIDGTMKSARYAFRLAGYRYISGPKNRRSVATKTRSLNGRSA